MYYESSYRSRPHTHADLRYIIAKLPGAQTVEDLDVLLPGNVDNNHVTYR